MRKTLFAVAILIAAAVAIPTSADEWHKTYTVSGHPHLRFITTGGSVDISARAARKMAS